MAENEAPEPGRRLHVTILLVGSRRALDNALEELGFVEDGDRVVERDGRLAFLSSCELQSRIDTDAGRGVYQSLARHRPVEAAVEEEAEPEAAEAAAHDVETSEGLEALKRRIEPADAFATIRPGRDGRVAARIFCTAARGG